MTSGRERWVEFNPRKYGEGGTQCEKLGFGKDEAGLWSRGKEHEATVPGGRVGGSEDRPAKPCILSSGFTLLSKKVRGIVKQLNNYIFKRLL